MGRWGRRRLAPWALLCFGSAAGAEESICADRPGLGSATCTAPAGHLQLETGLADWTLDRAGGQRETLLLLGATAVKYGLTDRSHIELDVTPFVRAASRGGGARDSASGFGDLVLRYKHRLTGDDAALETAAFPYVKLPTAKRALGNGKLEAGLVVPIAYSIPGSSLSIALSPELDWLADEDGSGHHLAMVQVAGLGAELSPRFSVSAELSGQWDWDPAGTVKQLLAGLSAAWLARADLQLDAGANFGLNRQSPDVQIYGGVSKRF